MYPGVELRLYRYVSVLAEELNFTQAALRLHVSQPTLSTQIRDLERDLDLRLFERTKGGQQVVLTSPGEAFAVQARLALVHADRAIQEARSARGTTNCNLAPRLFSADRFPGYLQGAMLPIRRESRRGCALCKRAHREARGCTDSWKTGCRPRDATSYGGPRHI